MKTARFALACFVLLILAALALPSGPALAKDQDVLTVEGPLQVDQSRQSVAVNKLVLAVDDGTYVYINNSDSASTLRDLAAFVQRNPGTSAVGEYMVINGLPVATTITVDNTREVEGELQVDVAKSAVRVGGIRLPVTENTELFLQDNWGVTLQDLADFVTAHPGTPAVVTYTSDASTYTATEIDVASSASVTGPLSVDVGSHHVTVGSITLSVDDTDLFINSAVVSLDAFAAFAQQHPNYPASADFTVGDPGVATDVSVDTTQRTTGSITVDMANTQVSINGLTLTVNWDTTVMINGDDTLLLQDLADFLQRNPGLQATVSYVPETGIVTEIDASTEVTVRGSFRVNVDASQVTVNGVTMGVNDFTSIYIDGDYGGLQDLADTATQFPGLAATATYSRDGGTVTAVDIEVVTENEVLGRLVVYPENDALTVNGVRLLVTSDSGVYIDDEPATLQQLAGFAAQHPDVEADAFYVIQGNVVDEIDVYTPDRSNVARRPLPKRLHPKHRHVRKPRDIVGLVTGIDVRRGLLQFHPRSQGRTLTIKVRRRTALELNAARLSLSQLAATFGSGQELWMETRYEPDTRVARRVWVEQLVAEGQGQVLGITARPAPNVRSAAAGLVVTLSSPSRAGHKGGSLQAQLFPQSIVMKGGRLTRVSKLRKGDSIAFDGFASNGTVFLPRIQINPPRR